MSDARSKLAEALENAKNKRAPGAPAQPKPSSPSPSRATSSRSSTPAPKPKQEKAPTPKKKKVPKPKKAGSSASSAMFKSFSKFANNMIDELKTATSEISPSALINTASDSIQSIRKAVGFENVAPHPNEHQEKTSDSSAESHDENTDTAPHHPETAAQSTPQSNVPSPQNGAQQPPGPMRSPAKVQRAASKKKKTTEAPKEDAEPSQEDLLAQLSGEQETTPAPQNATPPPPEPSGANGQPTSPAKVKRVASKKKKTESDNNDSEPSQEDLLQQLESNNPAADKQNEPEEPRAPQEDTPVQDEATGPSAPDNETSAQNQQTSPEAPAKKKPAPKAQPAAVSKTEHAVRSFHALHTLLNNPVWAPLILDPETKPSQLFAPRDNFDTNFANPVFRAGLKSASRLASSFGFEPEKMRFNQKLMDQIKSFSIDPEDKIKPHTENISSALGEEKVKDIMSIYHNKNFKHLLFSVSTRVGSFVPTIESLARIYLSLRKKEPLNSGARLQIQEEILMRYRKAPYTQEMGKKARNLALSYFMDYLSNYALKLYKDRFKDVPEGQDNIESHQRRHATIQAFCCDMIDEWAQKVALSTHAVTTIKAKFSELAEDHFNALTSGSPQS